MIILPIHKEIRDYLRSRHLLKKFEKQCKFLVRNPRYPSLHTEVLEPKHLKLFSFRIDKKYRAVFIFRNLDTIEVLDVNNHYK